MFPFIQVSHYTVSFNIKAYTEITYCIARKFGGNTIYCLKQKFNIPLTDFNLFVNGITAKAPVKIFWLYSNKPHTNVTMIHFISVNLDITLLVKYTQYKHIKFYTHKHQCGKNLHYSCNCTLP